MDIKTQEALKMIQEHIDMQQYDHAWDRCQQLIEALESQEQPLSYSKSAQEKAECDCSEFYGQPCKCEQQLSIEKLAEISPYGYVDDEDIAFARAIEKAHGIGVEK